MLQIASRRARLLNLCVRRLRQRQGLGRQLLTVLLDDARSHHTESVVLEVRPSNAVARRLYDSMGFTAVGTSRGYYPARIGREDAVVLALALR